jgi:NTE family protein
LITFLLGVSPALADLACPHPEVVDRPRIGLVLGGGGARGSAHIGVIQVLEEMNVPVDIVVGTSIGSLVGGLYATGLNGDQLKSVMLSIDWEELFRDSTARKDWPTRRKLDDGRGLFGPQFGVGKDASLLPPGAISGQSIFFFFETLVSARVQQDDFDALPIPYRAVATDIVTGEEVILGEGSLSLAMRSSMSVPGVFDPVQWGDHVLVDGGLANNLPIDVARAMGADIIIAVNVGSPLKGREELRTALGVVGQLSSIMVNRNSAAQIATLTAADLLITPPLGKDVSSADFSKSAKGIRIGYEAADGMRGSISRYSADPQVFRAHRAVIESCVSRPSTVDFVRINNESRFDDAVIQNLVTTQPGDPWDKKKLQYDVGQIYALGELDFAVNKVVIENDETGLEVQVKQDSRGTRFIETGLDFTGTWSENALNFRAAYLDTAVDGYGSELTVTAQLGEEPQLSTDLYKYLGPRRRYFVRPVIVAESFDLVNYTGGGKKRSVAEVNQYGGALGAGREFGNYGALAAGVRRLDGKVKQEIGEVALDGFDFDVGEYKASLYYDRLDNSFFPTSGSRLGLDYIHSDDALGADEEYQQVTLDATTVASFGRHTMQAAGRYYTTLDNDAPIYAQFRTGGFGRLSGYNTNELIGQNFAMVMGGYRYRLTKSELVLVPGYLGATLEYGQVAERSSDLFDDGLFNGSLYVGFDTPVGPLFIAWGFAEGGRQQFLLRLGRALDTGGSRVLF